MITPIEPEDDHHTLTIYLGRFKVLQMRGPLPPRKCLTAKDIGWPETGLPIPSPKKEKTE